jgi:hypothetical protein
MPVQILKPLLSHTKSFAASKGQFPTVVWDDLDMLCGELGHNRGGGSGSQIVQSRI